MQNLLNLFTKKEKLLPLPSAHPFAKQQWYPELAPKLTLLGHTARICPLVGLHILFIQLHGLNVLRHCNACTYYTNCIAIHMRGLKSVQYLTVCWIGCLPTKTQPADRPLSPSQQGTKRSKRVDNQPISFMAITHVIKFWMAVLIVMMMMMMVVMVMMVVIVVMVRAFIATLIW